MFYKKNEMIFNEIQTKHCDGVSCTYDCMVRNIYLSYISGLKIMGEHLEGQHRKCDGQDG